MVSFNVVSLFTKVLLTEAIKAISHHLLQDEILEEKSGLPTTSRDLPPNQPLPSLYIFSIGKLKGSVEKGDKSCF